MRAIVILLVSLGLAGPGHAQSALEPSPDRLPGAPSERAEEPERSAQDEKGDRPDASRPSLEERRAAQLDLMFGRLAKAAEKRRADRIARHIMRRLTQSGSDTVDILMERAGRAMKADDLGLALDLLDGVVRLKPEFAEGWNRRATAHFMRGDYSRSLSDIREVLVREPRHWGALAGLSMILVAVERKAEAVEVMDRALAIHPHLEEMRARRESLIEELEGSHI